MLYEVITDFPGGGSPGSRGRDGLRREKRILVLHRRGADRPGEGECPGLSEGSSRDCRRRPAEDPRKNRRGAQEGGGHGRDRLSGTERDPQIGDQAHRVRRPLEGRASSRPAGERKAVAPQGSADAAAGGSPGDERPDLHRGAAGEIREVARRITSYNVCYTKLLRRRIHFCYILMV